jgi:hypothetical protein
VLLPVDDVLDGIETGLLPQAMHVAALLLGLRAAGRIGFRRP